jgi:hypothetical protein
MSSSEAVEVREMTAVETVELFRKCTKLLQTSQEIEKEILTIVDEFGYLALAIMLAGLYMAATPHLASNVRLYLTEYREHGKQLLSRKAVHNVHRYGDSVLSTWETLFAVVASRLLCLLACMNFDNIFPGLFDVTPIAQGAIDDSRPRDSLRRQVLLSSETMIDQ